jgi:hypothetical protein
LEGVRLVPAPSLYALQRGEELKGKLDADSCESTEILPSLRRTNSQVAKEVRPFSGGHDFLRLFGTPLATN